MATVLVCGSRAWHDRGVILARLQSFPPGTIVMHGGCRGADLIAADVARSLGLETVCFPADWERFGRSAGLRRNQQMVEQRPAFVLAFHLGASRGTADTLRRARAAGIPCQVIGPGWSRS